MKPALRTSLWILAALAALLAIALFVAPWFVGQDVLLHLAQNLARKHGEVELSADPMHLRFLPQPSLVAHDVALRRQSEPTGGVVPKPILEAERLLVALAVLPLLGGEVEAAHFELVKPKLHLLCDEQGHWNWLPSNARVTGKKALQETSPALDFGPLSRANISITQGHLILEDIPRGATYELQDLDLEATASVLGDKLHVDSLTLSLRASGSSLPWEEPLPLQLLFTASLPLKQGHAAVEHLEANFWGASLSATLHADDVHATPTLQGDVSLVLPFTTLQRLLGPVAQETPLPRETLDASLTLQGPLENLRLPRIALAVKKEDDEPPSTLEGSGLLRLTASPAFSCELKGGDFDISPVLAVLRKEEEEGKLPLLPPADLFAWSEALSLDADLELASLRALGLRLENLRLSARVKDGSLTLGRPDEKNQEPLAQLAGGPLKGSLEAFREGRDMRFTASLALENADAATLLRPFLAEQVLTGRCAASLNASAAGAGWPEVLESLQGDIHLRVEQGDFPTLAEEALVRRFPLLEGNFRIQGIP